MAANVQQVSVASQEELESTIMSYIAQGFTVSNRTAESVTLFKKKEFNVVWAVVGFVLCFLPLLVYCVVYATQSDEMIVVRIASASLQAGAGSDVMFSADRQWWWDGSRWRDTQVELPPGAVISQDADSWWDGVEWRPVPAKDADPKPDAQAPSAPPSLEA